jgi:NAD(P)-dependent dehydrogenase (short-subunit alcohol dehydrogenase family)
MSLRIEGAVAVVTGVGSGIGSALAEALTRTGASVVASDIDGAQAHATAARLAAQDRRAVGLQADTSSLSEIHRLIEFARGEFGPVDIYAANAEIAGSMGPATTESDWDRVLDVDLWAHTRAAAVLVPEWVQRGRGHFISVASASGTLSHAEAAAYALSRAAAISAAEWLAISFGREGVGVSCVCGSGATTPALTDQTLNPEVGARVAAQMITDSRQVIEPGQLADAIVEAVRVDRHFVSTHDELPP